jgi:cell division protein FtsQ
VVMEMTPGVPAAYSFPVIRGMTESDPLPLRAARMQTFMRLVHNLDGDGGAQSGNPGKVQYSRNLQEVDLSDPGDVKVTVNSGTGPVLLHLGNEDFLPRFMVFLTNVQRWEQERGKLDSVDLRYGREVILNPDMSAAPPPAAPAPAPPAVPPAARPKVARIAAVHAKARAAMFRRYRHRRGKKRK